MARGVAKEVFNVSPGGVREEVNPATIPDGYYLSSDNWLVRRGVGSPRPGYVQVSTAVAAADRITGIGFRGSPLDGDNVVLHTLTAAYSWNGTSQAAITGTWTATTANKPVRLATYVSGGTTWCVRINEDNAMDKWSGTGSFANVAAAPTGRDITVVGGYLMVAAAAGDDYAVQWNTLNDVDTWPAANINRLVDTPGKLIGVRALNPLSAAIYKEDAVYIASLQAAQTAFQFQLVATTVGPMSPASVVATQGTHYWLADDYAIYAFDGARVRPLTVSLGNTIFSNLQNSNRRQTHGALMQRESNELWFFYPDVASAGVKKGFSISLATGQPAVSAFPHSFAHSITASSSWTKLNSVTINGLGTYSSTIDGLSTPFPTIDSMVGTATPSMILGDVDGKFYQFAGNATDAGTAIAWEFTHGFRPVAGLANRAELDALVSYWKKRSSAFTVTATVTASDSIGDAETSSTGTFDIGTDSNHLVTFRGTRGKWVKLKHNASSNVVNTEHRGAAILSWPRAMV